MPRQKKCQEGGQDRGGQTNPRDPRIRRTVSQGANPKDLKVTVQMTSIRKKGPEVNREDSSPEPLDRSSPVGDQKKSSAVTSGQIQTSGQPQSDKKLATEMWVEQHIPQWLKERKERTEEELLKFRQMGLDEKIKMIRIWQDRKRILLILSKAEEADRQKQQLLQHTQHQTTLGPLMSFKIHKTCLQELKHQVQHHKMCNNCPCKLPLVKAMEVDNKKGQERSSGTTGCNNNSMTATQQTLQTPLKKRKLNKNQRKRMNLKKKILTALKMTPTSLAERGEPSNKKTSISCKNTSTSNNSTPTTRLKFSQLVMLPMPRTDRGFSIWQNKLRETSGQLSQNLKKIADYCNAQLTTL